MSFAQFDQLLVALCVFAAGTYLARRKWRMARSQSDAKSCGGGCGCSKGLGRIQP